MSENLDTITCSFTNENSLYLAYMPCVKGGGLFVRTMHLLPMGTQVKLGLTLLTDAEVHEILCQVIWVTPKGAQGSKPAGIGLKFIDEKATFIVNKIETILAGMLKSTQVTDTM